MESMDLAFAISRNDVFVTSDLELDPVARQWESDFVGDQHPLLAENSSPFELIHLIRSIPVRWQCPDRFCFAICVDTGSLRATTADPWSHAIGIHGAAVRRYITVVTRLDLFVRQYRCVSQ